jgi:hypothetical protein
MKNEGWQQLVDAEPARSLTKHVRKREESE